jgi:hypothetical protein
MPKSAGARKSFWPGLLIPLLLLFASCSVEEVSTQEQPAEPATQEDPAQEAPAPQEATEAEAALVAALAEAEKDDRLVFLHTGADW